jgi:hypothetical protein
MRRLVNKTNVTPPSAHFSFGRIKDDDGTGNGTPVDEDVYGDMHQFFEKLMTEGGITANELPDGDYNGFQLFQAFAKYISDRIEAGTYTPTITNSLNVTSSTAKVTQYSRVGNVVTVAGSFDAVVTADSTDTAVELTLPIASDFASSFQAGGTGVFYGSSQSAEAHATASNSSNKIRFEWETPVGMAGNNRTMTFSVTYLIV